MAKARMLHNKISNSVQVNHISVPARLLFTWMISHADDEGRIKGEAEYIKGKVFPMTEYKCLEVEEMLQELSNQKLIYRWVTDDNWFIEFPSWLNHQQIRKNRFHKSQLPSYTHNIKSTIVQPLVVHKPTQYNQIKSKIKEINRGEWSNSHRKIKKLNGYIDPLSYEPINEGEYTALEVWKRLEPDNPKAFETTYLRAYINCLPPALFFQFASEVEQDKNIRSRGAIFNKKVDDYITKQCERLGNHPVHLIAK